MQRQPAPMRKIGFKTDVSAQFPKQSQRHHREGQTQEAVCSPVDPFGEPQLQRKREPNKYRSQESQVVDINMESISIQLKYLKAIAVPNL